MYKNIIFDFGQVLVHFDPDYMTSVYVHDKDDRRAVCDVVFDRQYWDKLDDGSISDEEVINGFCSKLPKRLQDSAIKVYGNWINNIPFIDGMKELIFELKNLGAKLYLLSNISVGFAENYQTVPEIAEVFSLFDGLVFSGPIGITKPSKEVFGYLLNKYSLKAEECIFVDDTKRNIEGAEKVGIKGYLFDGDAVKLKKELIG